MSTRPFPSIAVIVAYFGQLPLYFQLWLDSCRLNPDFDWFVFTDANWSGYAIPPNLHFRRLNLAEFGERMSRALEIEVRPGNAYKTCDFKPVYWVLLEREDRRFDYWGHCDLDMIYGDLRRYVTFERLESFDKIFSLGHFTLYRNSDFANQMFRRPHPTLDWREILADPLHRGFDEHIGVGLIWRAHRARMFKDESLVADIDPAIARFERAAPYVNDRDQLFYFDRGHVRRAWWRDGRIQTEEFIYIHFQKRKTMQALPPVGVQSYIIAPGGFFAFPDAGLTPELAQSLNPSSMKLHEISHRLRCAMRSFRRKRGFTRDIRGPAR